MARQESLNIVNYLTEETKANLAETLDGVIENIQVSAVSEVLKSKNGSGTPESGSVEYKRFANSQLQDKGTARAAGKGNQVKEKPVIVNINDNKEIIEELQGKDVRLYGIDGMAEKRKGNFAKRVTAYLDRKFFQTAKNAGTKYAGTATVVKDIVDELIVKAKTLSGDFIDGIDAEDLAIVLSASARKEMKNSLDELPNGTAPSNGLIGMYDSIQVHESTRLPENVTCFVMLKEAIALPYYTSEYDAEKIPLDDAVALETFLYCGCEALIPEAILYAESAE